MNRLRQLERGLRDGVRETPRMIATDLDGTLLRDDGSLSPRTLTALRRARKLGVHHVVVTGRPAARLGPVLDLMDYRGPVVCLHGAQIYDVASRTVRTAAELDRVAARAVVARVADRCGPLDLAVDTCGGRGEFVADERFGRRDPPHLAPDRRVPADRLWEQPVHKVVMRSRTISDAELLAAAAACGVPGIAITLGGPGYVELLPAHRNKATGLAEVAARLGVDRSQVAAFGDMPTDMPMLDWAGYGVAMGNGHADVRAAADLIAPANDDDGVAIVVDALLGGLDPLTRRCS